MRLKALAALLLLGASSAHAVRPLRLRLDVDVRRDGPSVHVDVAARNDGGAIARDVEAELRGIEGRLALAPEILPGTTARAGWLLSHDQWLSLRQVAAVRLRCRDDAHHVTSLVAVAAPLAPAHVRQARWPKRPVAEVDVEGEISSTEEIAWWGPEELGLRPEGRTSVRLDPVRDLSGTRTSFAMLLLPGDPEAPGRRVVVPFRATGLASTWQPEWGVLAAWLLACAAVALLVSRRRPIAAVLPAALAIAAVGAILLTILKPSLLLIDALPAGGDYASHAVGADWMSRELLPRGRLAGWHPGQYGGFPLFLFYFPLSFVLIALLDAATSLGIALKLGSIAGTILLPWAWHRGMRLLGAPEPAPVLAAAGSLWLLLLESQSTWGANLPSLLAGEFAYALGFTLAWLAMALAFRRIDDARLRAGVPLLLAATGLAHGYALVAAALGIGLLALAAPARFLSRAVRVAAWGALSFALLGAWMLPLLANLPWVNGFREKWILPSAWDLLPPLLWPAAGLVVLGAARRLVARRTEADAGPPPPAWLAAFGVSMLVFWKLGYSLGVVDIRFLPFFHGALILLACWELGAIVASLPGRGRVAGACVAVLAVAASAAVPVRFIPAWARWNFRGMQAAPGFGDFEAIQRDVAGDLSQPRVAWEHHPDHEDAGTIRAFEMTPLFSGRATLEGLYLQSAPLAPAVFHLQSLLSKHPSCPLPGYECGSVDVAQALALVRLLGADTLLTRSRDIQAELDARPDLARVATRGPHAAHRFRDAVPLVEPAAFLPVVDEGADWRRESHDWLRAAADLAVPLVVAPAPGADRAWPRVARYEPGRLPRTPLDAGAVRATIALQAERLIVRTSAPGHPLLVKVAWHPGWRTGDGSPLHLVAPGLMLLVPQSETVTITWGMGTPLRAGIVLTIVAAVVLLALSVRQVRLPERLGSVRASRVLAVATALGGIALLAAVALRHPWVDRAAKLASGQVHLAAREWEAAESDFRAVLRGREPHPLKDDAWMHLGLVAAERGEADEALRRWREFLDATPVSTYRTEVLLRSARLHLGRGDRAAAVALMREAVSAPLAPPHWRRTAALELSALDAPGDMP